MNASRSVFFAVLTLATLVGCRIEKPATVVPPPPSIEQFTASAAQVAPGTAATLSWKTNNATSVELREASTGELAVPAGTLEGTFVVTVNAASLFVLVARGPGGADARAVSVGLSSDALGDVTFQALPPIIPGGGSTTLAWTAPGADTVTLAAGGTTIPTAGQRSSGAVTVSPRFDTTYTLTTDGVARTVSVTVQPALLTASLSPRAAEVGDAITLQWTAAGADKVTVTSPGRGQLHEATTPADIESGSYVDLVPPTPNDGLVVYEIAAVKGAVRFTRTLEVNVGTGLAITRFTAPGYAAAGLTYSVRWETRAADRAELKVDGVTIHRTTTPTAALNGVFAFTAPMADFSVELIATNDRGARDARLVQIDAVGIPTSATLTASPASVTAGQPVTLTFASQDARRARIVDAQGQVVFSVTGQAAENGTATVYPSADTTYTLSADNLLGNPAVTATAAVTVTGTPVSVTQFPPTAIAGQLVTLQSAGELLIGFPHSQVLVSAQADFQDISGTGTKVLESSGSVTSIDLPFTTFLWGRRNTGSITISRAGWMAWGAPLLVNSSNATSLPASSAAPGMIAPFWDDLTLRADSGVYYQVVGNAPEQLLIVQWDKLQVGSTATTTVTFQVQIHQRGPVSFQYKTMNLTAGYTSFVVGLQGATGQLGISSNTAPVSNSANYYFSPVAPPADVRVAKGTNWGGYVKTGNVYTLVTRAAGAYIIPTDLGLTELMFRPSAAVPNGQYLEVINRTAGPLDMSGWELRSPGVPTYPVPMGFTLAPNVATVIGVSTNANENDDAGVTLAWSSSGFFLSEDAGTFTLGTADAGAGFTYTGPADGGRGQSIEVDPGPFVGTSGSPGLVACLATTTYGNQVPQQLGSPGTDVGCGFGYRLEVIAPNFKDISDAGTALINSPGTAVSSRVTPITLAPTLADPAPMVFGARRDIVSMSIDGWLVWGSTTTTATSNATVTSTTSTTRGKLAVFWDTNQTTPNVMPVSDLFWKRIAANEDPSTPALHWVFQWSHVRHISTTPADDLNFEIKLFENGVIEYHYADMTSGTTLNYANGNSATVWLEKPDGTQALVVNINQPTIRPNTAYRFVPR